MGGLLGARGESGKRLGAAQGVLEEQGQASELSFCMSGQYVRLRMTCMLGQY